MPDLHFQLRGWGVDDYHLMSPQIPQGVHARLDKKAGLLSY